MSELAVGGPLAEADLCDELRSHPVHAFVDKPFASVTGGTVCSRGGGVG